MFGQALIDTRQRTNELSQVGVAQKLTTCQHNFRRPP